MKRCSTCGVFKEDFYRSKKTKDGYHPMCKMCQDRSTKRYRRNVTISPPKEKKCSRCKEMKPAKEFHKTSLWKCGLQPFCKECKKVTGRKKPVDTKWQQFLAARTFAQGTHKMLYNV
jgi:hypothetical protein